MGRALGGLILPFALIACTPSAGTDSPGAGQSGRQGAVAQNPASSGNAEKAGSADVATDAANIAVITSFTGQGVVDNVLPAVDFDRQRMATLLSRSPFGFRIVDGAEASKESMESLMAKAAKDVGAQGTLFFYFAGHGNEDGSFVTKSGDEPFSRIVKAIKDARKQAGLGPVKRLIIMSDSCYSGNLVAGAQQVTKGGTFGLVARDAASLSLAAQSDSIAAVSSAGGGLYEQLFIFTAARPNQESQDFNEVAENGGTFTISLVKAMGNLWAQDRAATFKTFIDKTKEIAHGYNPNQMPMFRVDPGDLLQERVFTHLAVIQK